MTASLRPTPSPTEARFRTPLARARGLGSTQTGTEHFWLTRVTSVALVLLVAWLAWHLVRLAGADLETVRRGLADPLLSVPLLLFIVVGALHMRLGMQTIIEDYVSSEGCKVLALMLNTFVVILVGLTCVFAVLKLSFGA